MSALGSLVVSLSLEYAQYTRGLSKADQESLAFAQNAQRHFDTASNASKEFFAGVVKGAAAAGAAYLGVSAVIESLKGSIDTLAKLDDMSQKTGSSVENLSRLQKVASAFGQGFDEVDSSLNKLAKGMATVDDETNKTNKALAALGISSKDAAGNLRDPSEVMVDVAKQLQNYKDGAAKAALVTDLFGKSGANLLPYLNDLAENVDRFAGSSTEAAQKASELQDKLGVMRVRVEELWTGVASNLVPAFSDFIGALNDTNSKANALSTNELGTWADDTALGVARLVDVLKVIPKLMGAVSASFNVVNMDIQVAGAAAALLNVPLTLARVAKGESPLQDLKDLVAKRNQVLADANQKYDELWNKPANEMEQAMLARMAGRNSAADIIAKAISDANDPGKPALNYTTGNQKAVAEKISEYDKLIKSINEKIAAEQMEGQQTASLTEGQKLASNVMVEIRDGTLKLTEAEKIRVTGLLNQLLAEEQNNDAKKAAEKATLDAAQAHTKYIETMYKGLDKIKEDLEKQKEQNAQIGLSKEGIAALEAAKLDEQATTLEGIAIKQMDKNLDSEQYDILMAQAKALRDIASEKRFGAAKQASFDAAEEHRKAWEKANEQIAQSLTDSIMRGGKSAGEYLKDYFRTLILRPVVQMIANPIAGAINSAFGTPANGLSQGASYVNAGTSLYNGYMGMSSMGNTAAQLYQYGSTALTGGTAAVSTGAAGTGWVSAEGGASYLSTGASSIGSAFSTAVPYLAAAYAIYSIAKSLDHSGTYHTGALAEYSASGGLLTGSNGTHAGPRAGDTNYGTGFGGVDFSQQTADFVGGISKSIVGILDSTASTFGKTAGYTAATAFADDTSKDGAWGALLIQKMGQSVVNWNDTRNSSWAPREFGDGEAGRTQYLAELSKSVRTALDDIGLPGWAQSMLDNLGNAPALTDLAAVVDKINATQKALVSMGDAIAGFTTLSDAAVTALVSASGGVDSFVAGMNAFYEGYYTDAEKIANVSGQVSDALSAVGLAMPQTREEFRALVEQELALGESGASAVAALLRVSGAFGTVADYSKRMADEAIANAQRQADEAIASAQRQAEETARLQEEARQSAISAAKTALDNAMNGVDAAFSAVQRAVDAERKSITDAYNDQIKSINASITDVTGSVGKLASLSNSLRSTIDRMRLPDQYGADRASAQAQIQTAIAIAKAGGVLPDAESLASALNIVSQPSEQLFSSFKDYQADFLKTKNSIADLADITDLQKSIEDKTLSTLQDQLKATQDGYQDEMTRLDGVLSSAQAQIDAIKGIDNSVLSVATAIDNLSLALGVARAAKAADATVSAGGSTAPGTYGGMQVETAAKMSEIAAYGQKYGANSYYIIPGVNDYQSTLENAQNYIKQISSLTGSSPTIDDYFQLTKHMSAAEWQDIEKQFKDGLHPLQGFAVGTSYVPYDMTARVHEGEEITPRPYVDIQRADRDKTNALLSQLVEENRSMRAELSKLRSATDEGNRHLVRAANAVNGNPEAPMLVETAA